MSGRKRTTDRHYSAEDQALDQISKEAEERIQARRQVRAEAREIRLKEIERQQKEEEERQKGTDSTKTQSSYAGSRRGSDDSTDTDTASRDGKESKDQLRDLKHSLREMEEKFRQAMVTNAQLDNIKTSHIFQLELLKEQMEEKEEAMIEVQREYKEKCRELEFLKRDFNTMKLENEQYKQMLEIRDKLLKESGLVIIATDEGELSLTKCSDMADLPVGVSGTSLISEAAADLLKKAGEGTLGKLVQQDVILPTPTVQHTELNDKLADNESDKKGSDEKVEKLADVDNDEKAMVRNVEVELESKSDDGSNTGSDGSNAKPDVGTETSNSVDVTSDKSLNENKINEIPTVSDVNHAVDDIHNDSYGLKVNVENENGDNAATAKKGSENYENGEEKQASGVSGVSIENVEQNLGSGEISRRNVCELNEQGDENDEADEEDVFYESKSEIDVSPTEKDQNVFASESKKEQELETSQSEEKGERNVNPTEKEQENEPSQNEKEAEMIAICIEKELESDVIESEKELEYDENESEKSLRAALETPSMPVSWSCISLASDVTYHSESELLDNDDPETEFQNVDDDSLGHVTIDLVFSKDGTDLNENNSIVDAVENEVDRATRSVDDLGETVDNLVQTFEKNRESFVSCSDQPLDKMPGSDSDVEDIMNDVDKLSLNDIGGEIGVIGGLSDKEQEVSNLARGLLSDDHVDDDKLDSVFKSGIESEIEDIRMKVFAESYVSGIVNRAAAEVQQDSDYVSVKQSDTVDIRIPKRQYSKEVADELFPKFRESLSRGSVEILSPITQVESCSDDVKFLEFKVDTDADVVITSLEEGSSPSQFVEPFSPVTGFGVFYSGQYVDDVSDSGSESGVPIGSSVDTTEGADTNVNNEVKPVDVNIEQGADKENEVEELDKEEIIAETDKQDDKQNDDEENRTDENEEDKITNEEDVDRKAGNGEDVDRKAGNGEDVDRKAGNGEDVDRKAGNGEDVDRKADNGEDVDRKADNGEDVDRKAGNGEDVDRKADNGEDVDRKAGNGEDVDRKAGNGEDVDRKAGNGEDKDDVATSIDGGKLDSDSSHMVTDLDAPELDELLEKTITSTESEVSDLDLTVQSIESKEDTTEKDDQMNSELSTVKKSPDESGNIADNDNNNFEQGAVGGDEAELRAGPTVGGTAVEGVEGKRRSKESRSSVVSEGSIGEDGKKKKDSKKKKASKRGSKDEQKKPSKDEKKGSKDDARKQSKDECSVS